MQDSDTSGWERLIRSEIENLRIELEDEEIIEMRHETDVVLTIHLNETGHEVQFKEEWIYDYAVRHPHLPQEAKYKVILRGATRFQHAHAIIEYPDGRRYIHFLGPRPPKGITDEQLQHREWSIAIGNPKLVS